MNNTKGLQAQSRCDPGVWGRVFGANSDLGTNANLTIAGYDVALRPDRSRGLPSTNIAAHARRRGCQRDVSARPDRSRRKSHRIRPRGPCTGTCQRSRFKSTAVRPLATCAKGCPGCKRQDPSRYRGRQQGYGTQSQQSRWSCSTRRDPIRCRLSSGWGFDGKRCQ